MNSLEALQGSGLSMPEFDPQQIVEQIAASNPLAGALARMWLARRESVSNDEPSPASQSSVAGTDEAERLGRIVRRMHAEIECLRQRNDDLASALGACYLCWGTDIACRVCGGRGTPGHLQADSDLFVEYVLPVVRKMRTLPSKATNGTKETSQ